VLLVVAVLAAALRLGLSCSFRQNYYNWKNEVGSVPKSEVEYLRTGVMELTDSQQYLLLARSLPHFSWDGRPNTFRTPGYPAFIRIVACRISLLLVAQALLGGLSVLGIGWLTRRRFGTTAGVAAALLLAVDVPSLFYAGLAMSETLFAALVVLALVLHEKGTAVGTGLSLGLAVLVRPVGLVLALPFAIALAARHRWRPLGLLLAAFLLLPAFWCGRNLFHYGRLALTSNGAFNLLYADAAAVVASRARVPRDSARSLLAARTGIRADEQNPLRAAAAIERKAVDIIAHDPLRLAMLAGQGAVWTIAGTKSDELVSAVVRGTGSGFEASIGRRLGEARGKERWGVLGLSVLELLVTLGAFALALVALLRRRLRAAVALPVGLAASLVLAVGPFTDGRFRVPVMPLIYLAAAAALWARVRATEVVQWSREDGRAGRGTTAESGGRRGAGRAG
jgi:4-amino-4-deoxy-L-arabinose transferase-like glycosyltransferase